MRLEILMVTTDFWRWEQEGPDPRDQHLALEGFDRQGVKGISAIPFGVLESGIQTVHSQSHLSFPHGCELLVHLSPVSVMI